MYSCMARRKLAQTDPDVTTFNDTGLTCGTKYYYLDQIRAHHRSDFSQDSG